MGCGLVRLRVPSDRHTAPRDAYPLQMVPPTVKRAGFNFDYFLLQTMSTVHKPGQRVSVTLANGRTCTGVIYTIDPVSEAFYIATQRARRRHAMVIVMKHAIRSVEVAGACSEEELDRIIALYNSPAVHRPTATDAKRLRSLENWLKQNRIPFTLAKTGQHEELVAMGCVTIAPPYTQLSCKSTNDIVLARMCDLIGAMPQEEEED